jgi:DNA-binding transcriptional MerR regulator
MVSRTEAAPWPPIPGKRYFTTSETATLCRVKPHVLRYWEQEFPMLLPVKRRGNRRYYQRHDIQLIRDIRILLYEQRYTIQGARQQLLAALQPPVPDGVALPAVRMPPETARATAAVVPEPTELPQSPFHAPVIAIPPSTLGSPLAGGRSTAILAELEEILRILR